jgi:type IV secretory pathway VirB10-like protein
MNDIRGGRFVAIIIIIVCIFIILITYGLMHINDKPEGGGLINTGNQPQKLNNPDSNDALLRQVEAFSSANSGNNQKANTSIKTESANTPAADIKVPPIQQTGTPDNSEFISQKNKLKQDAELSRLKKHYAAHGSKTLVYSREGINESATNSQVNANQNQNSSGGSASQQANVAGGNNKIKTIKAQYSEGNTYTLIATTIIPAVILSELVSDNSGPVSAMVSDNIYDSKTTYQLLIPQGSKLIGFYDGNVAYGSSRIDVAWQQLCFPNGECIPLAQEPATDNKGSVGLHDQVDNHYWQLFGLNFIGSVINAGSNYAQNSANNGSGMLPSGGQVTQDMGQTTTQAINRKIQTSPTITIRQASDIRLILTNNMVLKPYTGQ